MTQRSGSIDIHGIQDTYTPIGLPLSGIYKRSFAYNTIKDRLPVILTKVIDNLSRSKDELIKIHGENVLNDIKNVIGAISKMKNEMVTNKSIQPLHLLDNDSKNDASVWNQVLETKTKIEGTVPKWFNTLWLYCECYMYRRLAQEFILSKTLHNYDPFEEQKKDGFINSIESIISLSRHVLQISESAKNLSLVDKQTKFETLCKIDLWGNRCDLSLSAGSANDQSGDPLKLLQSLDNDILSNDIEHVWNCLSKTSSNNIIVDIVLDNAGYELFTDFCLASFLIESGLAQKVRFYVKKYPWYVSDTRVTDFHWTVDYMRNSSSLELQKFSKLITNYLTNKIWTIEEELYWTGPYDFSEMKERDITLYKKLSNVTLVIFKGDLNYRKLLSDINWEYSTPFAQALRNFHPTNILSLRTIKSDVCVGLLPGQGEELFKKDENWMITGQYGLMQFSVVPAQ